MIELPLYNLLLRNIYKSKYLRIILAIFYDLKLYERQFIHTMNTYKL